MPGCNRPHNKSEMFGQTIEHDGFQPRRHDAARAAHCYSVSEKDIDQFIDLGTIENTDPYHERGDGRAKGESRCQGLWPEGK